MKVYTCIDHNTHYPVGGASIVIAEDKKRAKQLLNKELKEHGLEPNDYSLQEIDISIAHAIVLNDGDY